jgi:hypothetical protein
MLRNERRINDPIRRTDRRVAGTLDARAGDVVWPLSGVRRPFADFRWHGDAATDREAFDAIAAAWLLWTRWAGLEPVETLQRGAHRGRR